MQRLLLLTMALLTVAVLAAGCGDDEEVVSGGDTGDQPLGAGPYPVADLTIAYEHVDEGVSFTYRISCLGDTATVTTGDGAGDGAPEIDERRACLALAEPDVQTRLVDGAPADQMCTSQYGGADVAVITGTIDDEPVDTTVDRTDGCGISDWEDLLGPVLPSPIGMTE